MRILRVRHVELEYGQIFVAKIAEAAACRTSDMVSILQKCFRQLLSEASGNSSYQPVRHDLTPLRCSSRAKRIRLATLTVQLAIIGSVIR